MFDNWIKPLPPASQNQSFVDTRITAMPAQFIPPSSNEARSVGPSSYNSFSGPVMFLTTFSSTSKQRIRALYSDFSRHKGSNPVAYQCNIRWWQRALEELVSSGAQDGRVSSTRVSELALSGQLSLGAHRLQVGVAPAGTSRSHLSLGTWRRHHRGDSDLPQEAVIDAHL